MSLGVVTLLFALVYQVLPTCELRWRDVWVGALVTAGFFTIGKQIIGLYLGTSTVASSYGAAGSVVVLLVWVYYSAQVVLLGAEFTRYYVERFRGEPPPMRHATKGPPPSELTPAPAVRQALIGGHSGPRLRRAAMLPPVAAVPLRIVGHWRPRYGRH